MFNEKFLLCYVELRLFQQFRREYTPSTLHSFVFSSYTYCFFFQVTPQNVIRLREVRWTRWSRPISQARNEAPNSNYTVLLKPMLPMSANSVEFLESSHSNVLQWLEQLRRRHYQRRTNNFKPETAHHHCAHRVNFTFVNTHDTFRLYTKAGSHLLQICKLLQLRIVCFPRIFPQHFLTS